MLFFPSSEGKDFFMKKQIFLMLILVFGLPLSLSTSQTGKIVVQIKNLHSNNGQVLALIYNDDEGFPTDMDEAFQKTKAKITSYSSVLFFDKLPYGTYAIGVIHDENSDGELETNWLGIPKEGIGVSRDAKGTMGPPSFEDASFQLKSAELQLIITMKYL